MTAELEANMYSLAGEDRARLAGRLTLPKKHIEYAASGRMWPSSGPRNRLEVHDLPRWKASEKERFESLPRLVEQIQRRDGPRLGAACGTGVPPVRESSKTHG